MAHTAAPEAPAPESAKSPLVLTVEEGERQSFELTYRANADDPASLTTGTFHFKSSDEMSLEQQISLGKNGSLMSKLGEDMATATDEEITALAVSIRTAARDILHDVPDHVFAQLKDAHLLALLGAFGEAPA